MATLSADTTLIFVAALLGLATGIFIGEGIDELIRHRKFVAALIETDNKNGTSLLLKRGVVFLRPVARYLLRFPAIDKQVSQALQVFESRGYESDKESALSLVFAATLCAALIGGVISASVVCGIAVGCCAIVGVFWFVRNRSEKQSLSVRENVPEALRCMSTCFRAGLSLVQTLRHTAHEVGGALGELFDVAARRLEMGASPTEALSVLRRSQRIPELVFVAVALDVQHQSGGSIVPVLDAARESVEDELNLMRSLQVQTAQAKLSARIVTLMPFVLVALFALISPDFLMPFFTSVAGMGLLLLALGMEVAGVVLVRRMLNVDTG